MRQRAEEQESRSWKLEVRGWIRGTAKAGARLPHSKLGDEVG